MLAYRRPATLLARAFDTVVMADAGAPALEEEEEEEKERERESG